MMQVMRNLAASRAACPILDDDQIEAYLSRGDVPTGAAYLEVPPTKVVRIRHSGQIELRTEGALFMWADRLAALACKLEEE